MGYYDKEKQQRVIELGDLVFWLDDQGHPVRAKVELITAERIYLVATSSDPGAPGPVWFENRYGRRVVPRDVYVFEGVAYPNWDHIRIEG